MALANQLPESKTLTEILALWKRENFTGVAVFNVHRGIPGSVEFGRPLRIILDHETGQMEKTILTSEK